MGEAKCAPSLQAAAWAYGEKEQDFPIAVDLASHIIGSLMEQEFDVAHSCQLPPHEGMGHAFSFIYRRIMNGTTIPTVPIMLNTYYPQSADSQALLCPRASTAPGRRELAQQ